MQEMSRAGEIVFVDTRDQEAYTEGSVPGALYVPAGTSFATWAPWIIDPEMEERPIVVLARDEADAYELRDKLARVGIDGVAGVTSLEGVEKEPVPTVTRTSWRTPGRSSSWTCARRGSTKPGHIPAPPSCTADASCGASMSCRATGLSSSTARPARAAQCGRLAGRGLRHVVELEGSYAGWVKAQTRTVKA